SCELSGRLLDRDLPQCDRTQEDVWIVPEAVQQLVAQGRIGDDAPQRDMGVQQQAHDEMPKSAAILALVCGESQSPDRSSCPASEPTAVRLTRRTNGMILATGVPARSMMTSSPRSTRSMMRERCVLASCILK